MARAWVAAALALALSPLAAPAQEYAVKVKHPGLGDKSQVTATSNEEVEFKLLDDGGNALFEAKETKTKKFVFSDVGLERAGAGDELVRVKRRYDHAERKVKGERQTLPFQGKTVLIEKKGGQFLFQIEGDEAIEGKDAHELHEEFNKGGMRKLATEHFLPRKLVKVDEKWTYDVAPLAKAFMGDGKIEIDESKAIGAGKLTKVYQKNGKQFGVVELTMTFPVTNFTGDDGTKHATKNSKFTIKLEAEGCIDGTLDELRFKAFLDGNVRVEGFNANGMTGTLVISLHATSEELWSRAK
jgi:hypothetical protein